jgi:hypothetical protein
MFLVSWLLEVYKIGDEWEKEDVTVDGLFGSQGVFLVTLGPFAFFDVQKTKYLQMFSTILRQLGKLQHMFKYLHVRNSEEAEHLNNLSF